MHLNTRHRRCRGEVRIRRAKARSILEQLGYTAGPDRIVRDANQQKLAVEVRHTTFDIEVKTSLAVSDYWQRAGVGVDLSAITPQRSRDREYRATYPGFELLGNPTSGRWPG